jgi:DNA-directed RNA polymerase subunit RPC12/RpoP
MSRRCVNPGTYSSGSNDAGPPEFISNNYVECANCGDEIDLDEDVYTDDGDGDRLCEYCSPEQGEGEVEEEEDDVD